MRELLPTNFAMLALPRTLINLVVFCGIAACATPTTLSISSKSEFGPITLQTQAKLNNKADLTHVQPLEIDFAQIRSVPINNRSSQRLDPPRANGESTEPTISGYHLNGVDHLVAAWHQTNAGAAFDDSLLGSAVSHNSAQTWQTGTIALGTEGKTIHFDPFSTADQQSQSLWVGALMKPIAFPGLTGMHLSKSTAGSALSAPVTLFHGADDKPAMIFARDSNGLGRLVIPTRDFTHVSSDGQSLQSFAIPVGRRTIDRQPIQLADGQLVTLSSTDAIEQNQNYYGIYLQRSDDLGTNFTPLQLVRRNNFPLPENLDEAVPGRFRVAPFGRIAKTSNGTLYYVFADITESVGSERNVDVLLIKSVDRGQSWSNPILVHRPNVRDQFCPTMAIGSDGAINIIFFDTQRSTELDASLNASVDVSFVRSTDGGASFQQSFLTSAPFDTSNMIWHAYTNTFDFHFLSDYIGITAPAKTVYAIYPERFAPSDVGISVTRLEFSEIFSSGFE
jgi:hypothetical protein